MKTSLKIFIVLLISVAFQRCSDPVMDEANNKKISNASKEQSTGDETRKKLNTWTFTAIPHVWAPETPYDLTLAGTGNITVNWGDGTSDSYVLNETYTNLAHNYPQSQPYQLSISGDVKNITTFKSTYGTGLFDNISFEQLPNLKTIRVDLTETPAIMDLSTNTRLEWVSFVAVRNLQNLILPKRHAINNINLSTTELPVEVIDSVIDNIYNNVTKRKILGGTFDLGNMYWEEATDFMVLPSAESLVKLKELQEKYYWNIIPEVQ